MIRRVLPWLMFALTSGMAACAEWAGSELGGPSLSIVPLIGIGSGTVLLDDLDQLHVVVVPISSVGVLLGAVVDTTVPVDAAGDAMLTVPSSSSESAALPSDAPRHPLERWRRPVYRGRHRGREWCRR